MTITNAAIDNEEDIVAIPEAQMEEGMMSNDDIPAATAVLAEAVEPSAESDDTMTHALTGSNRFIPVAVASALLPENTSSSSEEDDLIRPDLLSASVYKPSRDATVGIVVKRVTVKRIEPEGLFGSSGFQVGDQVMSVNSESCEGLDSRGVAELIRNADGILTVVVRAPDGRADRVSSMVMKQNSNSRLGIGFRNRAGKLVISSVAEDGVFAHSLLNSSDTCISINGVACDRNIDATAAATMIRTSSSFVTIVVKTRHETGVVVAASAMEPSLTPSTAAAATYTGAVESSLPPNQSPQERINRDKRACGGFLFCIVVVVVIVAALVVSANNEDFSDYSSNCNYLTCNVCGRNCFNETFNNYDYCCRNESTYTCEVDCAANILCNICDYRYEEGLGGHYVCAEELTYAEYGECPCTYKLCDTCGFDCFNETTSQLDYCCDENYVYTCDDACPSEWAPSVFSPAAAPNAAPFFAPTF